MKNRKNDNLARRDPAAMLDENISRLLKAASDATVPSRRFTESLIDGALSEIDRIQVQKQDRAHRTTGSDWLERSLGWAAMVAAACSAGVAIIASIFLKMNFLLQSVVVLTMVFNWLTYLGEYIR